MPNPVLPSNFIPLVTHGGYSMTAPSGALRTEVAGGSNRYALDYNRGAQTHNISFLLGLDDFAVWSVFYLNITKRGTITFDMQLDTGLGVTTHAVNIVPDTYSASKNGERWTVSFQVETESMIFDVNDADSNNILTAYNAYGAGSPQLRLLLDTVGGFLSLDTDFTTGTSTDYYDWEHGGSETDGDLLTDKFLSIGGSSYQIEYIGDSASDFKIALHIIDGRADPIKSDLTYVAVETNLGVFLTLLYTADAVFTVDADTHPNAAPNSRVATWVWSGEAALSNGTNYLLKIKQG